MTTIRFRLRSSCRLRPAQPGRPRGARRGGRLPLLSVVVTILSLLVAACGANPGAPGSSGGATGTIKVGLGGGLTGSQSFLGEAQRDAAMLAADDINKAGGINGRKLELISEDDQFNPSRAASIAQKFINQDRVDAIIAGTNTGTALVYAQAAEAAHVPLIVSFASDDRITLGKRWSWALDVGVKELMVAVADAFSQHASKLQPFAFSYDDDAYGQAARDFGLAALTAKRLTPAVTVALPDGSTNYSPQVSRIKSAGAKVVIAGDGGNNVAQLAKNMAQSAYRPLILGPTSIGFTSMIGIGGSAVEHKVWFLDTIEDSNPRFQKFAKEFQARYHRVPETGFEGLGYDSVGILAAVFKKVGTDKAKVQQELDGIRYTGVSGTKGSEISFPADTHRRSSGAHWRWVDNGKFADVPADLVADPAKAVAS